VVRLLARGYGGKLQFLMRFLWHTRGLCAGHYNLNGLDAISIYRRSSYGSLARGLRFARAMIPISQRRRVAQNGSAMVEYALVISLFFMLVYGFVQFCLILFVYNNATYASRVAIRYAVVHGSTATYTCTASDISNIITPLLWGTPSGGATIVTTWSPNNTPGSTVSIKVGVQYIPKLPFFPTKTFVVGTTAYGTILQ
jgi:Flp pilus assembly protein TadG